MKTARLMNRNEDYQKLGEKKDSVEVWEDGLRNSFDAGHFEWWYFDAILDDGTKVVLRFATKNVNATDKDGNTPSVVLMINTPDGKSYTTPFADFNASEVHFSKETCDVEYGPHFFKGDLQNYHIHIEPLNGLGIDLKLDKTGQSWRGDTGYIAFGEDNVENQFFTWLCAVPKGSVKGTITIDGETRTVTGFGYHDHQWGNINHVEFVNTWLWARQNIGDYSILVFDFVLNKEYDYKRIPLAFIQDRSGNIIFENTEKVQCEILEEYFEETTREYFPKVTRYTFDHKDTKVTYTLSVKEVLESQDSYASAPESWKRLSDKYDAHPTYGRYLAEGDLIIEKGEQVTHESGELIYEFTYVGKEYKKYMEL